MTSNVFPVSYIEPCFLPSSLRLVFPHRFFSIPCSPFTAIISISLSLHLVLLAPVNSCELHNYHLVLSFCSCIRVAVCLPMFFPNKTNINTSNVTITLTLQQSFIRVIEDDYQYRKEVTYA